MTVRPSRADHRRAGPQGTRHSRRSRRRSRSPTSRTRSSRPAVAFLRAPRPAIRPRTAASCTSHRVARSRAATSCTSTRSPTAPRPSSGADRYLLLPADELAPPGDDEVYVHELPGMRVELESGELVGTVDRHVRAAAGTHARRRSARPARSVMIPYDRVVTSLDREARVHRHRSARRAARVTRCCASTSSRSFPTSSPAPLGLEHSVARARRRAASSTTSSTCATSPTTGIARSTTRRTAAVRAW